MKRTPRLVELGTKLAELHKELSEEEISEVLEIAFENRKMAGYENKLAEILEAFAVKLRSLRE